MARRMLAAIAAFAIAALPGFAGAHDDPNPDGGNNSPTRCDTWYRTDHESGPANNKHSEDHTSEFDQGQTGPVYIHNHTGHYVVRGEGFYIEVVGGGGYANEDGNQGGWVQAEFDVAEGVPDVDLHAATYAGTNGPMHEEKACISVANTKIGDQGDQPR